MNFNKLSFKYFLPLLFLGAIFTTNSADAQTNRDGSYSYKVSKDGYEANVKLYIYSEDGETYGRMRVEGNAKFGKAWEINLWSLTNGDYTDFYYELDPDNPLFTQDTHIMTLSGSQKTPLSVFGKELKAKITKLKPADVMKFESKKPTFEIKEKAKSQTVEIQGQDKKKGQ